MKQIFTIYVCAFALLATMWSCKSDDTTPESAPPTITVAMEELYSNPNRNFKIIAQIDDDYGLQNINISIPEFFLNKDISLQSNSLVKSYNLDYQFLAPKDFAVTDVFNVVITVTDLSKNQTVKTLKLKLNGDFVAPTLSKLTPDKGGLIFSNPPDTKLDVSFTVADPSGISRVFVAIPSLELSEEVLVEGKPLSYDFSHSFSIPNELKSYEMEITVTDSFIFPNSATTKVDFSVVDGYPRLFLYDLEKDKEFSDILTGVPMLHHKKDGGAFTFKYYADSDSKEIFFLAQATGFEPFFYGGTGTEGQLVKGDKTNAVVLPQKGYYMIVVEPNNGTYSATPYTPTSPAYNDIEFVICGGGFENGGWSPNSLSAPRLRGTGQNKYQLEGSIKVNNSDVQVTLTPFHEEGWWIDPYTRFDEYGVAVIGGGSNATYTPQSTGDFSVIWNTELERSFIYKK